MWFSVCWLAFAVFLYTPISKDRRKYSNSCKPPYFYTLSNQIPVLSKNLKRFRFANIPAVSVNCQPIAKRLFYFVGVSCNKGKRASKKPYLCEMLPRRQQPRTNRKNKPLKNSFHCKGNNIFLHCK